MYKKGIKKILDILLVSVSLILLSPIFFLVFCITLISNGGKPFFYQKRPGKNGNIFTIIKFRTMNDKVDENGNLLPFDKRITPLGTFLRKYSLDEIPQLINILKGDMSLVGPRPLLMEYLPLYNSYQKRRHEVKPGLTGLAQVNGRNSLSWDEKFDYDVWYVDHLSFGLDFKILLLTIKKVLLRDGINSQGSLNMPDFTGNDKHDE